jgi:hypothetical protein
MVQRCTNPKRQFWARYGGRGIKVYEPWLKFENFLADMGERPAGMTLDRKDNDKDYTPDNCVWATAKTQARNQSSTVRATINGDTRAVRDWCDHYQISYDTVRDRVRLYGMSYEQAITTPRQSRPGEILHARSTPVSRADDSGAAGGNG